MTLSWTTGFALNAIVGTAFITISIMLAVQITRTGQWRSNRIGSVFAVLVGFCGAGHALRALFALGPAIGLMGTPGIAMQIELSDWHMWISDGLAAVAGVFYVFGRIRDKDILETTRAFEDYRSRRRRAIEVHDGVVQNLLEAKLSLEQGQPDEARTSLHRGLQASKTIVSQHPSQTIEGQTIEDVNKEDQA